jgi:hypothetical protein
MRCCQGGKVVATTPRESYNYSMCTLHEGTAYAVMMTKTKYLLCRYLYITNSPSVFRVIANILVSVY